MIQHTIGMASLPNEILLQLLMTFETRALIPLSLVSHRFYDLVIRILQNRLLRVSSLEDHQLVLESFHPCSRLSAPPLACEYQGTDAFSNKTAAGSLYDDVPDCERLGKLSGLYSHFKPILPEETKTRRPHSAGDVPGHPDTSTLFPGPSLETEFKDEMPGSILRLESYEIFSQLVTITSLVKIGPRKGFFLSCVDIGEGVIRIWRNWLADRVTAAASLKSATLSTSTYPSTDELHCAESALERNARMLWLDKNKTVGLRLRVTEHQDEVNMSILLRADEDAPVAYKVQYEELVIKTTALLCTVEESLQQESNHACKTVVMWNWK